MSCPNKPSGDQWTLVHLSAAWRLLQGKVDVGWTAVTPRPPQAYTDLVEKSAVLCLNSEAVRAASSSSDLVTTDCWSEADVLQGDHQVESDFLIRLSSSTLRLAERKCDLGSAEGAMTFREGK